MNAMIFYVFFAMAAIAIGSSQSCLTDADCSGGCCAQSSSGNACKPLGKLNDVCDLEGQGLADGVCQCEQGLVCEKIDLGIFGSVAASANPILEKHHYGWCEEADSVVG